jgi:hypothetical protein
MDTLEYIKRIEANVKKNGEEIKQTIKVIDNISDVISGQQEALDELKIQISILSGEVSGRQRKIF